MPNRLFLILVLVSLLLATGPSRGEASALLATERITLVTGGEPAATLVIPADAPGPIEQAAEDLQRYVQAISGVQLPLHRDGKPVAGTGLYIGNCDASLRSDLPAADLNPESYAIRVRAGDLYFTGRGPTPAGFAVHDFIERDLGVRWFAPGELWEHVPSGTPGELQVQVTSRVVEPDTSPRIWSGHAWLPSWHAWNRRNKTVQSEVIPRRNFQNNLYRIFAPSRYAKSHPEYYPLIQGKRWIPAGDDYRYWLPCTSHPQVIAITVQAARAFFDAHPDVDSFSVGQDDIAQVCGCDACRAHDPSPEAYQNRQFSDRYYTFVNAVAREVRKTHPDRYIGALIYHIARDLPEKVDKLEENVFGFITENHFAWWQEGVQAADHELTRQWAKRAAHLSRYDYYGLGTFTPRFSPRTMAQQLKFDQSLGLEGMYVELYTFLPHTAPMIWALAKMQWDTSLEIDSLLEEFYTKMYGPAASVVEAYFDLLEKSWMTDRPGRTKQWAHRNILAQVQAMAPEDVDRGLDLLEQALALTEDPAMGQRIAIHRDALRYAGYAIHAYGLIDQVQALSIQDQASADQVLAAAEQLLALASQREVFWQVAHDRDDLLGETLRGLIGHGYLQAPRIALLEQALLGQVLAALNWYAEHDAGRSEAQWQRLMVGEASLGHILAAWRWVQAHQPKNLLINGDFRDRRAAPQRPVVPGTDWVSAGAPAGWSFWSRVGDGDYGVMDGEESDGPEAVAFIRGATRASLIQNIRVQPGKRYLISVKANISPGSDHGRVTLGARFHTPEGQWHPRRDLEPSITAEGGDGAWQDLTLLVEVPADTGAIVLLLWADRLLGDETARFADVQAYAIDG